MSTKILEYDSFDAFSASCSCFLHLAYTSSFDEAELAETYELLLIIEHRHVVLFEVETVGAVLGLWVERDRRVQWVGKSGMWKAEISLDVSYFYLQLLSIRDAIESDSVATSWSPIGRLADLGYHLLIDLLERFRGPSLN